MKKIIAGLSAVAALTFLGGCAETFTFEATPVGVDDDDAEEGIEGNPRDIECFTIEADSSNGDDGDAQLGTFCKTDAEPQQDEDDD